MSFNLFLKLTVKCSLCLIGTIAIMTASFAAFCQPLDSRFIAQTFDSSVVMIRLYDGANKEVKIGSGVVIHKDGTILTNAHVFETIWLRGEILNPLFKRPYAIKNASIQADYNNDIAFFKCDTANLTAVPIYYTDTVMKGEKVYCMGSPDGMSNLFTDGMVAGSHTITDDKQDRQFIIFTAKTFEGSSGGALIDQNGRLIGITTGSVSRRDLGFAIPVNRLIKHFASVGIKVDPKSGELSSVPPSLKGYRILNEKVLQANTGNLNFWTPCTNCKIEVYVDGVYVGIIEKNVTREPYCGEAGALTQKVAAGRHKVKAVDKQNLLEWNFEKDVLSQECKQVKFTARTN